MTQTAAPPAPVAPPRTPAKRSYLPWRNPWRKPYFLSAFTWLYILWTIVPIIIVVQFSFNAGRSRSTWQGFSTQWYWGDPDASVWADESLRLALTNSLSLAFTTVLIATPIGAALALGLTRWRGRPSKAANAVSLLPLITPEIVLGTALFLVFSNLYTALPLGRPALILGHVTFSISYVLVIVRSRLVSIGGDYEVAARDLGASPSQALRSVLIPLLYPSIFASAAIVFAISLDDFVVSAFLYADASAITVPIRLYSAVRGAPTPALNALATLLLLGSSMALLLAYLVLRSRKRGGGSALEDLAKLD